MKHDILDKRMAAQQQHEALCAAAGKLYIDSSSITEFNVEADVALIPKRFKRAFNTLYAVHDIVAKTANLKWLRPDIGDSTYITSLVSSAICRIALMKSLVLFLGCLTGLSAVLLAIERFVLGLSPVPVVATCLSCLCASVVFTAIYAFYKVILMHCEVDFADDCIEIAKKSCVRKAAVDVHR